MDEKAKLKSDNVNKTLLLKICFKKQFSITNQFSARDMQVKKWNLIFT